MNQLSSVESSPPSSVPQPLNPTIKAVLSSLDVHLEEELTRFRRQHKGKNPLSTNGSSRVKVDKTLDLISVKATGGRTDAANGVSMPTGGTQSEVRSPNQQDIPATDFATAEFSTPHSEAVDTNYAQSAPAATFMQPDDYLESSEALLKNLAEPENPLEQKQPERTQDGLLSPLGIGSMLLLLLASASLGYVVMNPASVSHLNRLFEPQKPKVAENSAKTPAPSGNGLVGGIPNSPNLASQEFDDLTLRSLSTVKPRVASIPSPAPRPQLPVSSPAPLPSSVASGVPLDLSGSLLPQPLQPTPGGTTTIQPAPGINNNQSNAARQSTANARSQDNRYLVVMEYSGSRSLSVARKAQPNAFVVTLPEGRRIQLTAFPTAPLARAKIQQLQSQGIKATLYRRPGV